MMSQESTRGRILIADDEPLYLQTTADLLRRAGFDCRTAMDAEGALQILSSEAIDLAIVDLNMPGNLDLELLNHGRHDYPDIPMIVATGAPSLQSAIDSVRLRISDYLLKPVKFDDLVASIRRALRRVDRPGSTDDAPEDDLILGEAPRIQAIRDLIRRAAPSDVSVLVTGESGTGKELVAQSLHQASPRRSAPFVVIDCTAIPESLFESVLFGHAKGAFTGAIAEQPGLLRGADGGTVFLDEIGELPYASQAKLLRLIQHGTFTPVGSAQPVSLNVRFVAATNRDLAEEVRRERFRRDLFYRLAVVPITLPPLRERETDVVLLARHFLKRISANTQARATNFSPEVLQYLQQYAWPGNIRELRNVVERMVALTDAQVIGVKELPANLLAPTKLDDAIGPAAATSRDAMLSQAERQYLQDLLRTSAGNVSHAAATAGLTRQGLYKLLAKHQMNAADFRSV